jgi:hypothetical protein
MTVVSLTSAVEIKEDRLLKEEGFELLWGLKKDCRL